MMSRRPRASRSSPALSRRRFLRGAVLAALGAVVAPVAIARSQGYVYSAREPLRALSTWQAVVVEAAAARVLAADDPGPGQARAPSPREVDVVGFVDAYVAGLAPDLRRDLMRLFAYLEHMAPLACGALSRFSRLGPAEQDRVLAAMATSPVALLRGGFDALKSLLFMGYYRDPRAWAVVGYDGPLVGRPSAP